MNFLFHLHLSGSNPDILTGNLMGDFVKGIIGDRYPLGVKAGLVLHRNIDSFAQSHPWFRQSKQRLDPRFGHWRSVLVDMFYDHFLAQEWDQWSPIPLDGYLEQSLRSIAQNKRYLPELLEERLDELFHTLIPSYQTPEGVGKALRRMGSRIRRPNPLADGVAELQLQREGLLRDFRLFMPEIETFAASYLSAVALDTGLRF